jgi:hypothetical protein
VARALGAFGVTGSTEITTVDAGLRHHNEPREISIRAARQVWEALASHAIAEGDPLPDRAALSPDERGHRARALHASNSLRSRFRRMRRRGIKTTVAMRLRRESPW